MTTFEQSREIALRIIEEARAIFAEDGRVTAAAFVIADQPTPMFFPMRAMMAMFDKDVASALLRAFCRDMGATAVVNVAEAWSAESEVKDGFCDASTLPEECENRKEIVFILLEHRDKTVAWQMKILRDDVQKPRLGDLEDLGRFDGTGRFMNILQTKKEIEA